MKTIVAADDNYHNCELVKNFLQPLGYQVETATSGTKALKLIHELKPVLIILDFHMPTSTLNGWQIAETLKSVDELKDIPILAVSAGHIFNPTEHPEDLLFDSYIQKPFRRQELQDAVEKLLQPSPSDIDT